MPTRTVIRKVNITSDFRNFWEIPLETILSIPKENIISAVVEDGALYLIYHREEEIEENN